MQCPSTDECCGLGIASNGAEMRGRNASGLVYFVLIAPQTDICALSSIDETERRIEAIAPRFCLSHDTYLIGRGQPPFSAAQRSA